MPKANNQSPNNPPRYKQLFSLRFSGYFRLSLLAIFVGAIAAYGTLLFRFVLSSAQNLVYGFSHSQVYTAASLLPWWQRLLAPALGGLLIGAILYPLLREKRPHGPVEALHQIKEGDGKISVRHGLGSAAIHATSLGVGSSLGIYGPVIHLGASLGSWVGQALNLSRKQVLILLGCGVSSGIASTFNAPIAGVIFTHEVMLGHYALSAFAPITLAAVIGTAIIRMHHGNTFAILVSRTEIEHFHEYALFAFLGLLSALLAVLFMRGLLRADEVVERLELPNWTQPAIGGLFIGLIAIWFPQVLGTGDEAIRAASQNNFIFGFMLALIAAKLLASWISMSFGFGGGVFGPSLFLGAMLGGAAGTLVNTFIPSGVSDPQIYVLTGMGAFISCVIGAPLTTIIIVFELTGSYSVTTAVMTGVVIANISSTKLFSRSFFLHLLHLKGVDPNEGREVKILKSKKVKHFMSPGFYSVTPTTPFSEVEKLLFATRFRREPTVSFGNTDLDEVTNNSKDRRYESTSVVDPERRKKDPIGRRRHGGDYNQRQYKHQSLLVVSEEGQLLGHISLFDLAKAEKSKNRNQIIARDMISDPGLILDGEMNLNTAMERLSHFIGISIPVVNNLKSRKPIGIIYESTLVEAYNQSVKQARNEERGIE